MRSALVHFTLSTIIVEPYTLVQVLHTSTHSNMRCTLLVNSTHTVHTVQTQLIYGVTSRAHCSLFHYKPHTLHQVNSHCGEVYKVHHPLHSTPTTIRSWGCQPASQALPFSSATPPSVFFSQVVAFFWTNIVI